MQKLEENFVHDMKNEYFFNRIIFSHVAPFELIGFVKKQNSCILIYLKKKSIYLKKTHKKR